MSRDLKINIGTTADTSGIDKTKASLVGLKSDIPQSLGALDISGLTQALGKAAHLIAGVAAAWSGAAKAVSEYAESEREMAKLDAALANSGKLTAEYREQLQGLATDLQNSTGIADEKWTAALTTLTKFGADSSNIDRYAEAVKNLAGFLGGDIEQAAFLFGKAMQGSTEMLGRYGIEVDKTASQTAQLDSIMAQLAQRGAGQLEAQAGTLTGQWSQLGNATSDVFESFGGLIASTQVLQAVMSDITGILRSINDAMGISVPQTEGLSNKFIQQAASAQDVKAAVDEYAKTLGDLDQANAAAQENTKAQIELLEQEAASTLAAAKAQKELALAKIEADSTLTKEAKAAARADIEKNFASTEIASEVALARDKVAAREAAIAQLEDAAAARRAELAAQRQRVESARETQAASQASGDRLAKLTADEQKIQAQLNKLLDQRTANQQNLGEDIVNTELGKSLDREIQTYQTALARIRAQQSSITDADKNARAAAEKEAAKLAQLEASTAAQDKKDATLAARLARENASDKAKADSAQKVATIEAQTADVKATQAIAQARAQDEELARKKELLELEIQINEAKATGNTTELARLEAIKAQSQATASGLTADQARRSANAAALLTPGIKDKSAPYSAPGELFPTTNRRRGIIESDAFGENALNLPPGGSLLDQYKANQSRPVGAINGKSILPADPSSSGSNAGSGIAGEAKSAASAIEGSSKELAAAAEALGKAGSSLSAQGISKLTAEVRALTAKVEALAKKI